jgi:plasmid stability protein
MAIIQVRDVPDEVQAELVRRAQAAGQSLQQYLRGLLITQTRRADPASVWAALEERATTAGATYPLSDAADDIRASREEDRAP